MTKGTTQIIGGIVGCLAGLFFGAQFAKPADIATTELIDKIDDDDDDVNALSKPEEKPQSDNLDINEK